MCNSNLIEDGEDYCPGCIRENNQLERQNVLRLKKRLPEMIKRFWMERYLENIKLINQIEVIEIEE